MDAERQEVNYQQFIPRETGFIFTFIKKGPNFIHTYVEGKLIEKIGLTPEKIIGKTLFDFMPEQQAKQKLLFYKKAWNGEYVNYEGHVGGIYYIVALSPIRKNSETIKVIATAIDITKEKETEIKVQQMEKLSMIGELAAGIAHEIRNPLTSIKGFTSIVKENVIENINNQDTLRYLDIMAEEMDSINRIVSEFMFIAKPKANINIQPTNLNRLLSNCIDFMQPQANLKSIKINALFQAELNMNCDPNQIKQVLINFLQNAIEATNENKCHIDVLLEEVSTQKLLIQITDRGCGISEDRQRKLFEPFYSTKEKGTGLGLITCKRIIDLHQGTIEIKSKQGEGTIISIYLPKSLKR